VPTRFSAIAASTEGGSTWVRQAPGTLAILTAVATTDDSHGCAVGGTEIEPWGMLIWATANGGATWKLQNKAGDPEQGMDAIVHPT
jgi:photosystem II stability/assembly factor-like uncharacterized protein